MKQVRAEQCARGLFEQNTSIPAVRNMRGRNKSKAKPAGLDDLYARHGSGRTNREIVQVHKRPHKTAHRFGARRLPEPFVERAALITLEMTKADVAELGGIDEGLDGLMEFAKHALVSRVEQQGLV